MIKKLFVLFTVLFTLLGIMSVSAQAKDWPAPIKALEARGVIVNSFTL